MSARERSSSDRDELRKMLDGAVGGLARMRPSGRGHEPHRLLEARVRVTTLAHALAMLENGGSSGYAPYLAESSERVLGARYSTTFEITGRLA